MVGFIKSLYDFRQEAKNFDLELRDMSDLWWIGFFSLVNLVSDSAMILSILEHQTGIQLFCVWRDNFWH